MAPTYLITGATGGLGHSILNTLIPLLPSGTLFAGSSNPAKRQKLEAQGVGFRHCNFSDKESLIKAFQGIDRLFVVSVDEFDNDTRVRLHRNAIEAAEAAGVGHVWYSSLAFGGYGDSDVFFQKAHLDTEKLLKESKLTWTSVREAIYADAFPVFMNWYPTDPNQVLYLPSDPAVALADREELGEATAKLMLKGGFENQIVLLSGPNAFRYSDVVKVINETTGRNVKLEIVPKKEYVRKCAENDEGGKNEAFFKAWAGMFDCMDKGDAATVSPTLSEVLERPAKDGLQVIKELLKKDRNFTWHQNYVNREKVRVC
ncbi:putative NmrA-like family protein [Patellaria atrata CBS 101060]|uniref:NmrA-like family protein n=1 Tax=Patellaria atrata CBS 101060 TaxID=1346257 RepID=A0A9P4VQC8_9PEZI|nr:putative NmrA-like family protein [Patellaria atrata CBS 101060]